MRSILTILGIAIAVGSFVAIVGLSQGLESAYTTSLKARGTQLLVIKKGTIDFFSMSIDEKLGIKIGRIDGVLSISGALGNMMTLEAKMPSMVEGWPLDSHLWNTINLTEGRLPRHGETDAVVLGQAAANALHKRADDSLKIDDRTFVIVGVFRMGGVIASNAVFMPLSTLQEMMERPAKVTGYHIQVDRPETPGRVDDVQARLQKAFPSLSFMQTDTVAENDYVLRLFRAMAWSISLLASLIALVVILNTLLMSVLDRTNEIGILSAVGWSRNRILYLFLLEGSLLALFGGFAGLALGVGCLHWLTSLPRLQGLIEGNASTFLLIEALVGAFGLGLAGSLYPAWRAARMQALDALRYE